MTHAYDSLYLEKGRTTLGFMLHYAVDGLCIPLKEFYALFLSTEIAARFGAGDVSLLAGRSGAELAHLVLEKAGIPQKRKALCAAIPRSKEYWTGWALGYYQWHSGRSFVEIESRVPIEQVRGMYDPYHEMDILQFTVALDSHFSDTASESTLARLRQYAALSQAMLAKRSGVPLRTIQQYEQRQKDIKKAGATHVLHLARALQVPPEVLLDQKI